MNRAALLGASVVVLLTTGCGSPTSDAAVEGTAPSTAMGGASGDTTVPTVSATAATQGTPTYGPDSTTVLEVRRRSSDLRLVVDAPPETRFEVSSEPDLRQPCEATTRTSGEMSRYAVVCLGGAKAKTLFSITTVGDFDYTFEKAVD